MNDKQNRLQEYVLALDEEQVARILPYIPRLEALIWADEEQARRIVEDIRKEVEKCKRARIC